MPGTLWSSSSGSWSDEKSAGKVRRGPVRLGWTGYIARVRGEQESGERKRTKKSSKKVRRFDVHSHGNRLLDTSKRNANSNVGATQWKPRPSSLSSTPSPPL